MAWRYRDYLIRAFNADVPYNQLVREHIAGDLLPHPRINAAESLNESAIGPAHLRMVEHGYVPVDALDDSVKVVDNQIDVATGTIQLRAEFANADGRLWPGQLVSAQLLVGTRRAALTVPARSVRQGLNGAYVFRVRDAVADVVPVRVAWQDDDLAVIDQGLDAGDRIVVDGYSRLRAGTPVKELTSPADAGTPQ